MSAAGGKIRALTRNPAGLLTKGGRFLQFRVVASMISWDIGLISITVSLKYDDIICK